MSIALRIFLVAFKAVLKVFIIGAVGCVARRRGLLDAPTCKAMAKLNGTILLPCLLFVALGKSVTIAQLRNVWILPISACVNIALGWTMGAVLVRLLRVPAAFRGPAVAASAFGNSLALPVVLIVAVVRSGEVGHLVFTEEDEAEAMLYLGAYMTTLTILMWTLGPMLYAHDDDDDQSERCEIVEDDSSAVILQMTSREQDGKRRDEGNARERRTRGSDDPRDEATGHASVAVVREPASSTAKTSASSDGVERSDSSGSTSATGRIIRALAPAANANVAASIVGICVGLIGPVRRAMFEPEGALYPAQDCAAILAGAAIPQVILILGASLANGPDHALCSRRVAVAVGLVRLALIPAVNIGLFLALRAAMPASSVPSSPAFWLTFLVEGATPTANNMMLQAQMYGSKAAAGGVGACLFYQYVMAPVLLTGTMSLFLAII